MLVLLSLLLALNGGAFAAPSFHPALSQTTGGASSTRMPNDGMTGTPEIAPPPPKIVPATPSSSVPVRKGFVPTRNDGMTGTPELCQC